MEFDLMPEKKPEIDVEKLLVDYGEKSKEVKGLQVSLAEKQKEIDVKAAMLEAKEKEIVEVTARVKIFSEKFAESSVKVERLEVLVKRANEKKPNRTRRMDEQRRKWTRW